MDAFTWLTSRRGHSADGALSTASSTRCGITARGLAVAVLLTAVLINCSSVRQEDPRSVSQKYKAGETVYVCGCPMMCCNIITREADGRCICNVPLKKGTVSEIHGNKIVVSVSGRGNKTIIANR